MQGGAVRELLAHPDTDPAHKRAHSVDIRNGSCLYGAGFRGIEQGELSTKWGTDQDAASDCSFLLQFNPQVIAGRVGQILPDAEVPLRGLDGLVAEGNLDLLDRSFSFVGELANVRRASWGASSSPILLARSVTTR
jgi:hypothetical protein